MQPQAMANWRYSMTQQHSITKHPAADLQLLACQVAATDSKACLNAA